ncbi:hypothetical protein TNCV_3099171 [Trichonephila clavipes]|nr:hypothetical protein TNCV_3099171 [Trichonephila clavipes]
MTAPTPRSARKEERSWLSNLGGIENGKLKDCKHSSPETKPVRKELKEKHFPDPETTSDKQQWTSRKRLKRLPEKLS